ncbi:MAG: PilZ domain-containing protein [Pseudolabrys sp.]
MPSELQMQAQERRQTLRHRTLKAGRISFNRSAVIDCRVRNLSPAGACLDVASPFGIPDDFVLVIAGDHLRQNCRVIWRTQTRLGVEFRVA